MGPIADMLDICQKDANDPERTSPSLFSTLIGFFLLFFRRLGAIGLSSMKMNLPTLIFAGLLGAVLSFSCDRPARALSYPKACEADTRWVFVRQNKQDGTSDVFCSATTNDIDGEPHHVASKCDINGGNADVKMRLINGKGIIYCAIRLPGDCELVCGRD